MRVHHQLGLGRGAGGEVELQRIAGAGLTVRLECRWRSIALLVLMPALHLAADRDAGTASASLFNLRRKICRADDMPHSSSGNAIRNVIGREQRGGGNDHRAQFHHRQHGLPQRRDVAEHEQHAVATAHAQAAIVVSEAIGPLRKLCECQLVLAAIFVGHPQRGLVAAIAGGNLVKPVQRPVEALKLRPLEAGVGGGVVVAMGEEEVAGGAEGSFLIPSIARDPYRYDKPGSDC